MDLLEVPSSLMTLVCVKLTHSKKMSGHKVIVLKIIIKRILLFEKNWNSVLDVRQLSYVFLVSSLLVEVYFQALLWSDECVWPLWRMS